MASEKITAIVESVKTMTVLELKELVDTICEEFGVSAVAAAAPAAIGATSEDPKVFGKALIFVALGEGIALYGLLISILILNKVA